VSNEANTSRPETIPVARASRQYLAELNALGLLQGQAGNKALRGQLEPVMNALHHVLAGGRVQVEVVEAGSASTVEDLDRLLQESVRETNDLEQGDRYTVQF
jgi:hypothetical protein